MPQLTAFVLPFFLMLLLSMVLSYRGKIKGTLKGKKIKITYFFIEEMTVSSGTSRLFALCPNACPAVQEDFMDLLKLCFMSGADAGLALFNLSLTNTVQPARLNLYLLNQNIIKESKAAKGRVGGRQGPQRVRVVGEDGPETAEDGPGALLANRPVSDCAEKLQAHRFRAQAGKSATGDARYSVRL